VADGPDLLRAQLVEAAVRLLEDEGVVVPPRSLLDMSYRDIRDLAGRGFSQSYALLWLSDRIPSWVSRPDVALVNVIKAGQGSDPRMLAEIARELHAVGIHDLDDLLPQEEPPGDQ
jgi:hypothetical protein